MPPSIVQLHLPVCIRGPYLTLSARTRLSEPMSYRALLTGLFAACLLMRPAPVQAQELDCSVSVDYSQLSGSDFTFLDELSRRVESYINERSWTDDRYQPAERISCSMQIILQEAVSLTEFRARIVVATLRPIYGTTQATPVVRLNDTNWRFSYARGTPLQFNLDDFDPLTSVLDYYAYMILGYDYDTFSELGGTPYFEQARAIAERARSAGGAGWSEIGGSQARTDLINQLLDQRYEPLRRAYFRYHLRGLDRFVVDTEAARQTILDVLQSVQTLYQQVSRSFAIDMFFAAKYQELAALYEGAPSRSQAYGILSQVDPSHTSEYDRLVN